MLQRITCGELRNRTRKESLTFEGDCLHNDGCQTGDSYERNVDTQSCVTIAEHRVEVDNSDHRRRS